LMEQLTRHSFCALVTAFQNGQHRRGESRRGMANFG